MNIEIDNELYNIGISILTWNNLEDTKIFIKSLCLEIKKISKKYNVKVYVYDNGSDNETIKYLENQKDVNFYFFYKSDLNKGISVAKNRLIDENIFDSNKYMFMFDNDQAVIPNSLITMIDFMECNFNVGCFAHNSIFFTKEIKDNRIPKEFPNLDFLDLSWNVKSGVGATRAWCSYSVYRVSVFEEGVKFEEDPPFNAPGYGFDDDDLGMQIKEMGYDIVAFNNIYVYHNVSSSVPLLKKQGCFNYNERKKYFLEKWGINE